VIAASRLVEEAAHGFFSIAIQNMRFSIGFRF